MSVLFVVKTTAGIAPLNSVCGRDVRFCCKFKMEGGGKDPAAMANSSGGQRAPTNRLTTKGPAANGRFKDRKTL